VSVATRREARPCAAASAVARGRTDHLHDAPDEPQDEERASAISSTPVVSRRLKDIVEVELRVAPSGWRLGLREREDGSADAHRAREPAHATHGR